MNPKGAIAEALSEIAMHARHYESVAALTDNFEAKFVFAEVAEMLESMARLKRSPLLDELNKRISDKPQDNLHFKVRHTAIAIAAMLMHVKKVSKSEACRQACSYVESANYNVLYQKSGLRSGFTLADANQLDEDVQRYIHTHREFLAKELGREPTDAEVLDALISMGDAVGDNAGDTDWRVKNIKKAIHGTLPETYAMVSKRCWGNGELLDSFMQDRHEAYQREMLKP